jgi:tRNA modification GTPase
VDTIAAIASAPGRGAIGIVRVSGAGTEELALKLFGKLPPPRRATRLSVVDDDGALLDEGLVIYFPGPASYTGESVLEWQGHGGQAVLHAVLGRVLACGARRARPGEFTERAFLAGRLDLAQAEAVADLIDAASAEAVRSAARSLTGEFSRAVDGLSASVTQLRVRIEGDIDFPEEEALDAVRGRAWVDEAARLRDEVGALLARAEQGALLRDGVSVAIAGLPNVGKSSLLNALAGEDVAIVTPIAGTTRDPVRATVLVGGVALNLVDTAGLRESDDPVERLGVSRAGGEIERAGIILWVSAPDVAGSEQCPFAEDPRCLRVVNKSDLAASRSAGGLSVSASTGKGMVQLREALARAAGMRACGEGALCARARHIDALHRAAALLERVAQERQVELAAEGLRETARALGEIVGQGAADDLLGEIFSRFCIGK